MPPHLTKKHRDELAASGLDAETIRVFGFYSERDPDALSRLLNWEHPAKALGSCLVIPFVDAGGNPTNYRRLKPEHPPTLPGCTEPAKYLSPRESTNRAYLTPRSRQVIDDPRAALLFVEGEKKAAKGDQEGFNCVGGVGVWGFCRKQTDEERERGAPRRLLEDLEAFKWPERPVYVVFDSDAVYKDLVRLAEWELAKVLHALGAVVKVVRLPARLGGPKVGLDDFLVAHGRAAFQKLLDRAGPAAEPPFGFTNCLRVQAPDKAAGDTVPMPRSAADMAAELVGKSGGWPRVVAGSLSVPDQGGGVRQVGDPHALAAYLHQRYDAGGVSRVHFEKGPSHVSPPQLLAYLTSNCERFDRADRYPHVPPIPGVLYLADAPEPDGKFAALERFMSFFNFPTDHDRALFQAAIMTPLWGGPAGKRPAFLFESAEGDSAGGRGVGKSTAAQMIAKVYGGPFDVKSEDTFARTTTRLLSPEAQNCRVLLMDNVKTFRLSSADLESLVTNPYVNGHRMYRGQGGVPNYFTLIITLNGPSLSRDFAQRVIPTRFMRAAFRESWESELDAFIERDRMRLIGDLIGVFRSRPAKLHKVTRWAKWESEVLARVDDPDGCQRLIAERTGGMDADQETADRIAEAFVDLVRRELSADANTRRYLLKSAALTRVVELGTNSRQSSSDATALLKSLDDSRFQQSHRNGDRTWLWSGPDAPPVDGKGQAPPRVNYYRKGTEERWEFGGQEAGSRAEDIPL